MSDTSSSQPQAQGVPLVVNAQYVKDLSFENPNAPAMLVPTDKAPQLDIGIDIQTRAGPDSSYEVTLHIKATAKMDDKVAFIAELSYAGLVTLKGMPEDAVKPVLLIEVPRILFPFARNILADITRDGGFAPLMLNPIDFAGMYRQNFMQPAAGAA